VVTKYLKMKVKLLKKVKRKVKLYKRNGLYFVDIGCLISQFDSEESAMRYYRTWIKRAAKTMFGFRPKQQIL